MQLIQQQKGFHSALYSHRLRLTYPGNVNTSAEIPRVNQGWHCITLSDHTMAMVSYIRTCDVLN